MSFRDQLFNKSTTTALSWVDPDGYRYDQLVLNGRSITAKDGAYVFGKKKLSGKCQLTFKFTNIGDYVGLGVIDIQNKDKNGTKWNDNYIQYCSNGYCWVSGSKVRKSSGFKAGVISQKKEKTIEL